MGSDALKMEAEGFSETLVSYRVNRDGIDLSDRNKVKIKLSLCLTKYHAMKTYWRVEV
jgi:hypothetical protein